MTQKLERIGTAVSMHRRLTMWIAGGLVTGLLLLGQASWATIYTDIGAESGNISGWSPVYDGQAGGDSGPPVASQSRVHSGSWAYKLEVTNPTHHNLGNDCQITGKPQNVNNMGGPNGGYITGYYSWWTYIDAGFTDQNRDWDMLLGWMTNDTVSGHFAPSPIMHIGTDYRNGVLQLTVTPKWCNPSYICTGNLPCTCPTIPNYLLSSGRWWMTSTSPYGIVAFPRQQWVHLEVYYLMSRRNGAMKVWQNGQLLFDLTANDFDTLDGHSSGTNTSGDMVIQFGIYMSNGTDGVQRLYLDDFKVSDVHLGPGIIVELPPPTNLRIVP